MIRAQKFAFIGALFLAGVCAQTADAKPMTPRQIYKSAGKSVVLVFGTDGSAQGSAGTGSVISKDGQIITNAHVVVKNGRPFRKVFVYLKPDKLTGSMKKDLKHRFKATVVDYNPDLDLALLRMVNPPANLKHIDFVDPDKVEIGEPVVAIGHPETGGLWTLTTGTISSVVANFQGIRGKDVFQTEASVNRGNSGGPLLNAYGQMVGINTCISRKAADGLAITDINFSLKSSVAVEWLKRRTLMNLAYVSPPPPDAQVVAMAETAKPQSPVVVAEKPAAPAVKPEAGVNAEGKEVHTIKDTDGKTIVVVVEPDQGEEVAEDPEFSQAADAQIVSRVMRDKRSKRNYRPKKTRRNRRAKHLTKHRPYKLEPFVSERVREIRALEGMMDDMRRTIDKKRGGRSKKSKGLGLW